MFLVVGVLAALLEPAFQRLRAVLPRGLAAGVTVLGTLAVLIGLFSFVGNQFAAQLDDIIGQMTKGLSQTRDWAETVAVAWLRSRVMPSLAPRMPLISVLLICSLSPLHVAC